MFGLVSQSELQKLEEELSDYRGRNIELRGEMEAERIKMANEKAELQTEFEKLRIEKERLEKENEVLRKYYDFDKEPSDEVKAKVHIDLEVNRLKEENMNLRMVALRQPLYVPQPYMYMPFWRF